MHLAVVRYNPNGLHRPLNEGAIEIGELCAPCTPSDLFLELVRREDQPAVCQVDAAANRAKLLLEAISSGLPANLLTLFKRGFTNSQTKRLARHAERLIG